jgi:TnpA family transposase
LRRTIYAARYLADETYRRRIARQLNKGGNLHALRRSLAYAGEGALRRRHHEQQSEQMWCLTLATNAIACWSTEYHGLGVAALRQAGRDVDDEVLAHIWPTHHENVQVAELPQQGGDLRGAGVQLVELPGGEGR